ncbi:Multidrug resistance-associated protein 1 [Geodia barretti]|nr:Multidrug resistance-associated protein 1 [Geodia barretti]
MGVLDDLDKFCGYSLSGDSPYRFTQFWRTKGNCLRAWSSGGEGSGLSSNNVTCHDYVDLSVCFEDTAILIGICVIFWLLAGLMFLVTTCTPVTRPLPFSRLHASKLLLVVLLMATGLCDLGYTVYQEISGDYGGIAQYLYFSPGTIVVTAVIGLLVLWQERRDGVRSSALFTILWFSLSCYAILKLRSLILLAEDQHGVEDEFRFTTFCVQFGLYLLQLVLVLLPEPLPKGQLRDPAAKKPCPEESATFLSRITWWWLNGLIWRGWRKDLEYSDLTDLNPQDKSAVVAGNFQKSWESEVHRTQKPVAGGGRRKGYQPVSIQDDNEASVDSSPRQPTSEGDTVVRVVPSSRQRRREAEPSLVLALLKSFWPVLLASAFFKLVQDLLNFVSPQVLKLLITFTEDRDEPDWKGYFYAALLFVTAVVQSLFLHQYFHRCFTLGMRMRSAIVAAIYKKALCLNNKSRREKTVGEIVNLMSVDAQRFMDLMTYFHLIWSAPLQIVLALLFLYFTMGVSIFAGFALMILMIPFNAAIAAKSRKYQV